MESCIRDETQVPYRYASRRETCPACGYMTTWDEYDICGVCRWERDHLQELEPDYGGGANQLSLREAQRNVQRFGAADPRSKANACRPSESEICDPEWRRIDDADPSSGAANPYRYASRRETCPSCGYLTTSAPYDVCRVCG